MKKLFQKDETMFAVVLIIIYVVGSSLVARVSAMAGIRFLGEAVFNVLMTAGLLWFILKNRLTAHVGLCKPGISAGKMLFYIPLVLLVAGKLCFGVAPQFSALEIALRTVMMLCVGFLEEIIFRGFLFRGMAKSNLKSAVIVSALTFGVGHIVNLFNGYDIVKSLCQIAGAVALGFLLVMIFVRTGSLIACIIFHGVFNSSSAFVSNEVLLNMTNSQQAVDWITTAITIVLTLAYLVYVLKCVPKNNLLK